MMKAGELRAMASEARRVREVTDTWSATKKESLRQSLQLSTPRTGPGNDPVEKERVGVVRRKS